LLYIIGGAPRVGKTIIAQEFLERENTPFLSLDLLKLCLVNSLPQARINPKDSSAEVAGQMWPVVRELCLAILQNKRDYLVEGDAILPTHIGELVDKFPDDVRACFLGFENSNPMERLMLVRQHPGPEDWLAKFEDNEVLAMLDEMIEFSRQLHDDAAARRIPYFESLTNFEDFKDQVLLYLVNGRT
jgi:hypothetical protein